VAIVLDLDTLKEKMQELKTLTAMQENRIEKLESEYEAINQLATNVAVMAEQMKSMTTSLNSLNTKVDNLEGKSGKRWDGIVDKLIWALFAAVLAYFLAKAGVQ
jgi:tetrahydromethanopterin S-methyltransferase subunit B